MIMEIEVGHCYIQRNPLWGRAVARVNRQVQSSVLDFERFDATIIKITDGLELIEHQTIPLTIFTNTGYEPVDEQLFLKLLAMARMMRAAAQAKIDAEKGSTRQKECAQQIENLLRTYGIIDDTPMQHYADAYAKGMKNLLDGVYDVVDVHK